MQAVLFPGQGSQYVGMGKALFAAYPLMTQQASDIVGYAIDELCLRDPGHQLNNTQYTQPALYVVNALAYRQWLESNVGAPVDFLVGHSLGELCALLAAGCFDFETGLRLVQKRGLLMSRAGPGGMAAVLGMRGDALRALLQAEGLDAIDQANINSPTQVVIAGDMESLAKAEKLLAARHVQCIMLNVSAPFHSRHMLHVQRDFSDFLSRFVFSDPVIPVVANATGRPYASGRVAELLAAQIASPVRWMESIRYLMGRGAFDYVEIGADPTRVGGNVLGKLTDEIRRTESPIHDEEALAAALADPPATASTAGMATSCRAQNLGSPAFRERYGIRYAYVAGAMYRGTASKELVIRMGQAGLIGYLGTGGLGLSEIEQAIQAIQGALSPGVAYGMNLLADYINPAAEREVVDLYLKHGVKNIEAAAFMQMTAALVLFRVKGLSRDVEGRAHCAHRILGKVSRLEVAEAFMSPPPDAIVEALRKEGVITEDQAVLAKDVPMSHDLCIEADSGGHTDGGIPTILLPAMQELRKKITARYEYDERICMGAAGGIGTPMAAAAAFIMGADFILTGSINQCSVESGASAIVKAMLQDASIHDMAYAPAGDMFEMGARVQVLKRGLLFPMRANKLYSLYTHHDSLESVPASVLSQIENNYFRRSIGQVWEEVESHLSGTGRSHDIVKAKANSKFRMSLVFRWYFGYSTRLAFSGSSEDLVNYQVHTGPALGAFNQQAKGGPMESWTRRHVDQIAESLMEATAEHLASKRCG